nr:upf0481 protein [Quercus suber]
MGDHIAPSEDSEQRGGPKYSIKIPPPAQQMEPEKRCECCIYKVPLKLRRVNEDAYTPKLISIGPYHHKRKNLKKMEDLKRRYFRDACDRTKKSPEDLSGRIRKHDYQKILHCYAEDSHMKEEEFMTMILLDSIFIIEQLWRTNENPPISPPAMTTISQKCKWRIFVGDSDFEKIFAGKKKEVKHFTDFLRYSLLPQNLTFGRSFECVPCATKLSEAGVEFKVSKSENGGLLDIQFRKSGFLKICPFLNFSWLLSCFPCLKCLEIMQPVLELKSFIITDATECVV